MLNVRPQKKIPMHMNDRRHALKVMAGAGVAAGAATATAREPERALRGRWH